MKVSGTSILTRKELISREFGADAWRAFYRDVALLNPAFRGPITASSTIPVAEFLAFQDELVRRFHGDRPGALFDLGAASARWVLVDGPLKDFVQGADIHSLVASMPKLWHRYFSETESRSDALLTDSGVELHIRDLPAWHAYFENFVMGYMKEMLEIYCANPVTAQRLTGGASTSFSYLLATDPLPNPGRSRRHADSEHPLVRPAKVLTDRQLEVLQLVGTGKTNAEIALLLRISEKTVQHHVAHAYGKLGVYSRTGATVWLAERGLLC